MLFRSKNKVGSAKRVLIKVLYKLKIPINDIVNFTGVSRATVYRHLNK